jgi:ubiquinone/menaquinone biosynthesis C-methylase UbiE
VENDRLALQEIHRVLKPGGQAVIMVPFMMHQTETIEYDQPDPELFYHVREYSPIDFKHKLELFDYQEYLPEVLLSAEEIEQFRVPNSQAIYVCTKKAPVEYPAPTAALV